MSLGGYRIGEIPHHWDEIYRMLEGHRVAFDSLVYFTASPTFEFVKLAGSPGIQVSHFATPRAWPRLIESTKFDSLFIFLLSVQST